MQVFRIYFLIYNLCGMWRPSALSSNVAKLFYNVFSIFVIFSQYFLVLTQFMDIVLIVDNVDDFATNALMWLSIVAVCCKVNVASLRQKAIVNLMQVLMKTPCKPCDEDEVAIQMKFDKFIRSIMIKWLLMGASSCTGVLLGSITNIMQGHLPYRIWLPLNYNVPLTFLIISVHQVITISFTTIINVGTDSLIFALIMQTCAQLEIFENRLDKLITNKTVKYLGHALSSSNKSTMEISECVRHHLTIYKYAKTLNTIFNQVFFVQFFGSILLTCTSVYYLSVHIMELSGTASFLVYTVATFVQIYIYCWCGNEVIFKSTSVGDAIYCTNWPLLSVKEKKALLLIMLRSTIPIKFTSSFLITLSLQSYSNILKTSYSAFNLLQK